jgi:hypothetical protein
MQSKSIECPIRAAIIERDRKIERLYAEGASYRQIAAAVRMSPMGLWHRCRKLSLPSRPLSAGIKDE